MAVEAKTANEETTQRTNSGEESGAADFLEMTLPDESPQVEYHDDEAESLADLDTQGNDFNTQNDDITADSYRGLKDDKGNAFDPSLHQSPPEKTPGGKWKRIPKGKRESAESDSGPTPNAQNRMEAQKAAGIYHALHCAIFPDDNTPNAPYLTMLTDSIEQYYNENGAIEIPAGYNVILSAGMYSQEMACRESNIVKVKKWCKSAWSFVSGSKRRKGKADSASVKESLQKGAEKKDENVNSFYHKNS